MYGLLMFSLESFGVTIIPKFKSLTPIIPANHDPDLDLDLDL